ncbi:hypothetical protein [Campylobacter sp. LR286c]|uniref:hypothetical protein n=1 Tax=Campylobacter sp. LR286c TaxID=2593545 RepID=UPI001237BB2D|nr:hypothetical protein [Campylobacter sp. LR286c]KAA6229911.1 hypothetical protein FMM57_00020 [Campylobacter sp. LR286c]
MSFKRINFSYYKYIGVLAYNKKALEFFVNTKQGYLESIEGLERLRFIENNKEFIYVKVEECKSLSVYTLKDLDMIRITMNAENEGLMITQKNKLLLCFASTVGHLNLIEYHLQILKLLGFKDENIVFALKKIGF